MSISFPNLVLPRGLGWNFAKRSKFSTILQTPQSMRHPASATLQVGVIYELELTFNYLKNSGVTFLDDANYLQAFYEACHGGYDWFTFDPSTYNLDGMSVSHDYTLIRNGFFGLGDGTTTSFPLYRSTAVFGGGTVTYCELIQNVTTLASVYVNGAAVSLSTLTQTNYPATIVFNSAPASGATLAWEGSYSYLCRFSEDLLDMNEFLYQLWELKSLKLETVNI